MAVALYRITGGFMTPGEGVAVVLMSLEFSRTLMLVADFFFAGAVGREVARNVVNFLDERPPVKSSPHAHPGATSKQPFSIEFRNLTDT